LFQTVDEIIKQRVTLSLKGNGNMVETFRPITSFRKIIFGVEGSYKIKTNRQIKVKLNFVYEGVNSDEELKIQTDQNLQKYFLVESNGEYLNIKLDYLKPQEDTYSLVKTNEYVLNSSGSQIEITTKRSNIDVIRKNFQPFDLSINNHGSCETEEDNKNSINFNCNIITVFRQYATELKCFRLGVDYKNC
jgi:hypothetical protein